MMLREAKTTKYKVSLALKSGIQSCHLGDTNDKDKANEGKVAAHEDSEDENDSLPVPRASPSQNFCSMEKHGQRHE